MLENSHKGPVLVHFWTPKAGPCFILMPRLVKLAAEYGGKFLLVMLNADELPELARRFSVNSVPTVKFFWRGEVAHTIHGADPDSSFREVLDRFIAGDANRAHALGVAAWKSGNVQQARMLLANAAMAEPDNLAIPRDLAKLLWAEGDGEQALKLLDSLPPEARAEPDDRPPACAPEPGGNGTAGAAAGEIDARLDAARRTTSTRTISVPRCCWRRTILPARWKRCFSSPAPIAAIATTSAAPACWRCSTCWAARIR